VKLVLLDCFQHPTPSLTNKTQISKKIQDIKHFQKLLDYV
jgi:hypothetical protein